MSLEKSLETTKEIEQLLKTQEQQAEERKIKKAELWKKLKNLVTGEYAGKEEEFEAIDEMRKVIFKLERLI